MICAVLPVCVFTVVEAEQSSASGRPRPMPSHTPVGTPADTGNPHKLEITIPLIEYTGSAPKVSGPDIVEQLLPFRALHNGTDPLFSIAYHTSDTAP